MLWMTGETQAPARDNRLSSRVGHRGLWNLWTRWWGRATTLSGPNGLSSTIHSPYYYDN